MTDTTTATPAATAATPLRAHVDSLIARAHATGYGSELPASVTGVLTAIADAVGSGTVAAPANDAAALAQMQQQIAALEAVKPAVPTGPDPAIAALEAQVAAVKAEVDALVKALSGLAPMATAAAPAKAAPTA